MVYGTDQLIAPAAFQEMKNFFEKMPSDKIRAHHGQGSPAEVLLGVLAGLDVFESDFPLTVAEQGAAVIMKDIDLSGVKQVADQKDSFLSLAKSLHQTQ